MLNPQTTLAVTGLARNSYAIVRRLANNRGFAALAAATVPLACAGLVWAAGPEPRVRITTTAGRNIEVSVELATTPSAQSRGLMFRQHLDPHHGMLFIFRNDINRSFWMKNTPLSLDIIFIDSERQIVGIQADTKPYSERQLRVGHPSRYVLEMKAGFCQREGVEVGDSLEFVDIDS